MHTAYILTMEQKTRSTMQIYSRKQGVNMLQKELHVNYDGG